MGAVLHVPWSLLTIWNITSRSLANRREAGQLTFKLMESHSQRAQNKKSLLSAGLLMLSLAALQGPLWRTQQTLPRVPVPSGGATLVRADRAVAAVALDGDQMASAEIVGVREVLIRGKELGETRLSVSTKDGHVIQYRVVVQAESARSPLSSFPVR